ncbi:hypothetical protein GQ54DRAFT_320969 [Martensiomyces pterosporus]|nr:hypothetical protein GQ54DRAFT_320969 [Martensiomyces pterosporus]
MSNTDPKSRFISEAAIDEARREREEAWKKAYEAGEAPTPTPDADHDPRTLYERLQEQRQRKDEAYAESRRFGNQIRKLDQGETEFLESVDDHEREKVEDQKRKEILELAAFKDEVASKKQRTGAAKSSAATRERRARNQPARSIIGRISGAVVVKHPGAHGKQDSGGGADRASEAGRLKVDPDAKKSRSASPSSPSSPSAAAAPGGRRDKQLEPSQEPASNPLALLSSYATDSESE